MLQSKGTGLKKTSFAKGVCHVSTDTSHGALDSPLSFQETYDGQSQGESTQTEDSHTVPTKPKRPVTLFILFLYSLKKGAPTAN